MFQSWVEAGLHHVNVLIDTLDAELFKVLRKHGRLEVFVDNLLRMVGVFRSCRDTPKIRFIPLAFEPNFEELETIAGRCHEEWMRTKHEVRYMCDAEHITEEFRRIHLPSRDRWPELKSRLGRLTAPHVVISPPEEGYEEQWITPSNDFELVRFQPPTEPPDFTPPLKLRGNIFLVGQEGRFSVNVTTLADPAAYLVKAMRESVAEMQAR